MRKIIITLSAVLAFNAHGETIIETQATNNGVKKCAMSLKKVGDFILADKAHSTHSTWHNKNSDNRMYASLTSKYYSDGDSHVSVIAAPTSSGECDSTYIETFAFGKSCMLTREEIYKDWKYLGTMNKKTLMLENEGGSVNVYLTDQGNNDDICLVTKREVLYP